MEHPPPSEAQQRVRAQRRARNAQALYLVLGAALLGLGAGLGASPLCWISDVQVVAPDAALAQAVARVIHVPAEASIIFFPIAVLERQATSLPQVQSVAIERASFHRLVVNVTRRVPVALVAQGQGQGLLLVGADGVITNLIPPGDKAPRLPLFLGLPVASPQPGGRLDATSTELVAEGAQAAGDAGLATNLRLDCTQPLDVRLTAGGVEGFLGATDNLGRKVSLFAQVLRDLRRQGGDPAYIDVRVMDRPVWMPRGNEALSGAGAAAGPAAVAPDKAKPVSAVSGEPTRSRAGTAADGKLAPAPARRWPAAKADKSAFAGPRPGPHHPQTPTGDTAVD